MKQWIRLIFLIYLSCTTFLTAKINLEPQTDEEAFFVRRMIEYYQEEEFELFEREVQEFLNEYPQSTLRDHLLTLLSDHFIKKGKYQEASEIYEKVQSDEVKQKTIVNYLQSLYHTNSYDLLLITAEPFLDMFSESDLQKHEQIRFLYADSLYRKSLDTSQSNETRADLAKQAINLLEDLTSSSVSVDALQSLAHLYYLTKQFPKSATLYLDLAEKLPNQKEKMLFKAATIQIRFNKELAAQTFTQICHIGKEYVHSAAYNRMVLLYDLKRYPELILAKDQLLRSLAKEKIPLLHFFLGQSHIERKDLKRAITELKTFLESPNPTDPQKKIALLSLVQIANDTEDLPLFDQYLPFLSSYQEQDSKVYEALFAHALICKKKKLYSRAKEDFVNLEKSPLLQEKILFEHAHLSYLLKEFKVCQDQLKSFITKYPESPSIPTSVRLLWQTCQKLADDPTDPFSKQDIVSNLKALLDTDLKLNTKERQEYLFLLAKYQYETKSYDGSISNLKQLLKQNLSKELLKESYLLIGYCFKDAHQDHSKFCSYVEKALQMDPPTKNKGALHIALFNSYQKLGFETHEAKGASHLYCALKENESVQIENLLWLANYYFKKNNIPKAIFAYEKAFPSEEFSKLSLPYEDEIVKLSRLYLLSYEDEKCYALLDLLEKQYLKAPFEKWKYPKEVRFQLASYLEKINDIEKAVIYYDEVVKHSSSLRDYAVAKSFLQGARLRLKTITQEQFHKKNPAVVKILDHLKNLTIQKTLTNEPIHFEAGFEYIDLLCQLERKEDQYSKRLLLLENMKNSFSTTQTLIDKEYHQMRTNNPDKEKIYLKYMELLEGEILLTQALIQGENDRTLKDKAHSIFDQLKSDTSLNSFLIQRIESHLKTLQSSY